MSASTLKTCCFKDPVYGLAIPMSGVFLKIIDTPQFQRLRYITQLGAAYMVFPGARHTRFEHSIGTCYLAGHFIRKLRETLPKEVRKNLISDDDIKAVQIAALCHDLGHGPFSHLFEDILAEVKRPPGTKKWEHEDASEKMFDYMLSDNGLIGSEDEQLRPEIVSLVKCLIAGKPNDDQGPQRPNFLFEIVSNKATGIDVDKFDYFMRDCYYAGTHSDFDYVRVMDGAKLMKDKNGVYQICFRDKVADDLIDLFYIRYHIHRRICKHPTVKLYERMISDMLQKADRYLARFFGGQSLLEVANCPEKFILIQDYLLQLLKLPAANVADASLKEAVALMKRIERREAYQEIAKVTIQGMNEEDSKRFQHEVELKANDLEIDIRNICFIIIPFTFGSSTGSDRDKKELGLKLENLNFFRKYENSIRKLNRSGAAYQRFERMKAVCTYVEVHIYWRSKFDNADQTAKNNSEQQRKVNNSKFDTADAAEQQRKVKNIVDDIACSDFVSE